MGKENGARFEWDDEDYRAERGTRSMLIDYNGVFELYIRDFEDMEVAVGGDFEHFGVPLIDGVDFYIDDEGMFNQTANRAIVASEAMEANGYLRQLRLPGYEGDVVKCGEYYISLHGPILAVGPEDEYGEPTPLSDAQVKAILEAFRDDGPMGIGSGKALEEAILMKAGL